MRAGPDPAISTTREFGRLTALLVALTIVFTYPLVRDLTGSLLAIGPDGHLFMWTLSWDAHAFLHQPLAIFDANIFHPQTNTLAYSENLIGSAMLVAPLLWITGNPVLAVNAVALLSNVLCGMGAYVLARRLGIGRPGAVLAAIVFAFSPPRFFRTGQLHLGAVQWVPFGLAYLHAYLDRGRARDLRLAAGFFTLQTLTSGHGAMMMALACVSLLLYKLVRGAPVAPLQRLRDLGVTGALLLAPAALISLPYRAARQANPEMHRSLENWVIAPESYLASPSHLHQWLWSLVSDRRVLETANAYLFPGVLVLALAAAALVWRRRGERGADDRAFYAVLTGLSIWIFLPPPVGLWPLIYDWPGLNLTRVPSRFSILAMLGIAMLAGFGFDRLCRACSPRTTRIAAAVAAVVMVAEFAAMPMALERGPAEFPAADRWLDGQPKPFVVAELPVADFERRQSEFMLHSMAHWQKTVHGYSGFWPLPHQDLYRRMRSFPDDASLAALRRFGVSYLVVHTDLYAPGEWDRVQQAVGQQGDALQLLHVAGSGRVYRLLGAADRPGR